MFIHNTSISNDFKGGGGHVKIPTINNAKLNGVEDNIMRGVTWPFDFDLRFNITIFFLDTLLRLFASCVHLSRGSCIANFIKNCVISRKKATGKRVEKFKG